MAEVKATKAVTGVTLSLSREEAEKLLTALESLDYANTPVSIDEFADSLAEDITNVLDDKEVA